jgi:hypothetical protein
VYPLLAAGMAILLSSCFVLQSFGILATSLRRGEKTKAQFVLHPMQEAAQYAGEPIRNRYQFMVVGVPDTDPNPLRILGAVWATNGRFGGPAPMVVSSALPLAMRDSGTCFASGLTFVDLYDSGELVFKAFLTNGPVNDHGKVDVKSIVQVGLRATPDAPRNASYPVFGVTGGWADDGDGVVNGADVFWCTGIASSNVYTA